MYDENAAPAPCYGRLNGGFRIHIIVPGHVPGHHTNGVTVALCGARPSGKRGRWHKVSSTAAGFPCRKCQELHDAE